MFSNRLLIGSGALTAGLGLAGHFNFFIVNRLSSATFLFNLPSNHVAIFVKPNLRLIRFEIIFATFLSVPSRCTSWDIRQTFPGSGYQYRSYSYHIDI
jgi:hypothetical protein